MAETKLVENQPRKLARVNDSHNAIVELIDSEFESTLRETGVDYNSQYNPYNPDDLYQKAGDYSIYESMMKDDQVNVAMNIKKDLIAGSGYQFISSDQDDEDLRKDLEMAFNSDIENSFEDVLDEIMTAFEFGFSVTQKQFKTRDDGSLTLKNLKTRDPVSWLFHQDIFGNIERYEQQGSDERFLNIDPNAIMHFINNPRFGNPYGTSDLRSAYAAYFVKKQLIRFYAIFLEKAASPIPYAEYDKNIATDKDITEIFNTLKKFQASTALVIPKEFKVNFLESKGNGDVYIKGINLFNMFIGRALFVPDLLGFQGAETTGGSQALGQEQMQIFFKHIFKRRKSIERLINKNLVEPIIKWNYGNVDSYPQFKFKPIEEKVAIRNAELWLQAIKAPSYKVTNEDINHFKKIIDFPETNFDEIDDLDNLDDPIEEQSKEEIPEIGGSDETESKEDFKFELPNGDYHKKTDFKVLERLLDSSLDLFKAEVKPIINDIYDKFANKLRKMNIVEKNKVEKLKDLSLDKVLLNRLEKAVNKHLGAVYDQSQKIAQSEIIKQKFAVQPAREFLNTLEAENFNYINDWEYNVSKKARISIIEAIKDGKPISSVIDVLEKDGKLSSFNSTERYARTKFTEVMNKGRVHFFESTGAVEGYQYSAILDDRTTEICRGLHGKKFKRGEAPIPPNHWNCRSLLIPITIFEEFEPDKKVGKTNINQFIDNNLGKGFARN